MFLSRSLIRLPVNCWRSYASKSSGKLSTRINLKNNKIESVASSLASQGFLRSNAPYTPPTAVGQTIETICQSLEMPADSKLDNLAVKFELLTSCQKAFDGHQVPNSRLHEMRTIQDVIEFYETAVNVTTPIDQLNNNKMDLPKNLFIQSDYVRFNSESDTMFGGKTAFPKSSTLVTGLKNRKKYKGNQAKRSWY